MDKKQQKPKYFEKSFFFFHWSFAPQTRLAKGENKGREAAAQPLRAGQEGVARVGSACGPYNANHSFNYHNHLKWLEAWECRVEL